MSLAEAQLSPGQGRAVTLSRVSSRERAAKPGRETRSIVGMISFHKEKGGKESIPFKMGEEESIPFKMGEKESITFKRVLSKSCLPFALLCWPFLAERDSGSGLAKPGLVCCQLLGSFPEILSIFGKRLLGLGSQLRFISSRSLTLADFGTVLCRLLVWRALRWGLELNLE